MAHLLVPTILRSERYALLSGHIMLITMTKRDTAAAITFPVDYRREGDTVYVGSDSAWWTHLQGGKGGIEEIATVDLQACVMD